MAGYEQTFEAICEKCGNVFNSNGIVYSSLNIDFKGNAANKLRCDKLNRIVCDICNTEFTYERPFIAYSFKNKYAVVADFNYDSFCHTSGRSYLFDLFKIKDFKFRIVNYLCEVSEKIRIFESGLDDVIIELIKINNFDKQYFSDKLNKILVFDKLDNTTLYFKLLSDTDEVLEVFKLPYELYLEYSYDYKFEYDANGLIKWYKIDDTTVNKLNKI